MSLHAASHAVLITSKERAVHCAELLKAVAHPLRLRIVAILCQGPHHVGALASDLEEPQAVVSQQLRILRLRGLVAFERRQGFAFYRLAEPALQDLIGCMERCSVR